MASRSLGQLTIDLIAKIGGFTQGMTQAERVADQKSREMEQKLKKRAEAVEKAWAGIGAAVTAGVAGLSVGALFSKVVTETRNAEQEQALLAAALKATGNQAGYSQGRLNDMAAALEGVTTKSAGEFNQAQTVLLGFTNIAGEQLPKALMQAANFSIRTGADMKSSAETIGRALDIPSVGMASLAKQGFKFSESQIEAAQKLERTGRIAEAQKMVLDALEETYGGAAVAARDTFGGSLDGLRNTINGLLTGGGGSLDEAKKAINDLTGTLSSNTTKASFETIVGWVVGLTNTVIQATANIVAFINTADKLGALTGTDAFGKMKSGAEAATAEVKRLGDQLDRHQEALSRDPGNATTQRMFNNTKNLLAAAIRRAEGASGTLRQWIETQATPVKPDLVPAPDLTPRKPGSVNLKDGSGGSSKANKDLDAAKKYLQTLNEQVFKTQEKTAYEKLEFDIKNKGLKLSEDQLAKAQGLATMIDMAKEGEKQRVANIERQNLLYEMQERLMSKNQQYQLLLMQYGMGDQGAANLRERVGLLQKHQAELRKIYQDQTNALSGVESESEVNRIKSVFSDRLRVVQQAQQEELSMFDQFIQQKQQKERDWLLGAQSALATYREQAANVYDQTKQLATNALSSIENGFVDLAMKGSFSMKDMANNIIAEIIRIQIRAAMAGLLGNLFGGVAGLVGGAVAGNAGWGNYSSAGLKSAYGFDTGGYTGPGGKFEPAGIVHKGEGVLSQEDMRALGGPGAFETFRRSLHGYSSGGVVGARAATAPLASAMGSPEFNLSVQIINQGQPMQVQSQEMTRGDGGQALLKVIVDQAVNTVAEQLAGNRGVVGGAMRTRKNLGM